MHIGNKDKVCLFYVVPDKCRPIFGLPDLTSMRLLAFDIPLEHQWEPNTDNELGMISSIDSSLIQQMVLNQYHDVFTGLGRLKVEPVKFI